MNTTKPPVICLMGPTASGKTPLAVKMVQHFPCEIISVDSAMVYRGMDIGTAKPDAATLQMAPHRLIDILEPTQAYSAGQFRQDAIGEIEAIQAAGKIPLLVGGTMLYFRVLQQGIAALPQADAVIRAELQSDIQQHGLHALHAQLAAVDAAAAGRINPNDSQRIQRALEVYRLTGKTITALQQEHTQPSNDYTFYYLGLRLQDRQQLHERIAQRFNLMLAQGLLDEVRGLFHRGDLDATMPSIRSVGYRQVWDYLLGLTDYEAMRMQAIAATRQLAKRQMTWLNAWPDLHWLDAENSEKVSDEAFDYLKKNIFA